MLLETYSLTEAEKSRIECAEGYRAGGAESIERLITMLADPSWVVRRAVVNSLAELGEPAVEPLCQSLKINRENEAQIAANVDALVASTAQVEPRIIELTHDPDDAIAADAAQILGRRRNQVAVSALVDLVEHKSDNVAVAAVEALGRVGGRAAVEALIMAVNSGNFFRIFPAIDVLGRSGDPRVVEPLAKLLSNPSYLPEAARALGRTGESAAANSLIRLLSSSSNAVVRVAALSLWELRERFEEKTGGEAIIIEELIRSQVRPEMIRRLTQVFSIADTAEAISICQLLGVIGSIEAMPVLTEALRAEESIATCAAESLKKIGKEAEEPLLQALQSGNSALRKVLLRVVSRASAAEAVTECLSDEDPEVRVLACDTLARLGNVIAVPHLYKLLGDTNLRVAHSTIAAIQALGSREARELAVRAYESENAAVRRGAIRILAYFGDRYALKPLLLALEDEDVKVREAALQGLPYLEDPEAKEALFAMSKSADSRTRALAMRSLGQVPKVSERLVSLLLRGLGDGDPWVRYYACQALGRVGYTPATKDIAALLNDEAGQVRVSAVEALSHLNSPESHEALRGAVNFEDIEVRRAALVGLGITKRPEDLPIILSAVHSSDVPTRLMALGALVNFDAPSVLTNLSSAALDSEEQVSSTAIRFIAGRIEPEATEVLVELLKSESTRERAQSALLVPTHGRVAGILVALESANDELSVILVSVLAKLEGPEARKGLLATMKLTNIAARKAAASGLAARRDFEMQNLLREAAENDPSPEVRQICSILLRG